MRLEDRAIKEGVERVMTVPSGNLHIEVVDDEIFVTESSFYAAYCKPANQSHLVLRRRTATDDHELLARWVLFNDLDSEDAA
jgi:hypothetical protein